MKNRFDLKRLARELGRSGIKLRPITHNRQSERAYRSAMRKLVREIARSMRVVPTDAALSRLAAEARKAAQRATPTALDGVAGILTREERAHRAKWIASVRSTIGIDLSRVVGPSDIGREWNEVLRRNARLIRDVSDDAVNRIQQAVSRATINGDSHSRLAEVLREQIGFVGRRADFIARDQIASAVSDLNKLRQDQAGVEKYEWSTSGDERVRDEHAELDGQVFRWDRPGPDNGSHPGQAINCRCVAIAVVE